MADSDMDGLSDSDNEQAETQLLPGASFQDTTQDISIEPESQLETQKLPIPDDNDDEEDGRESENAQEDEKGGEGDNGEEDANEDAEGEEEDEEDRDGDEGDGNNLKRSVSDFEEEDDDEEGDDDGDDKEDGVKKNTSHKKSKNDKKRSRFVLDEADESGDDDEEGDDEDDQPNQEDYEDDGFVVKDDEDKEEEDEEDGLDTSEDDEPTNKRLKKRRGRGGGSDEEMEYDEEDLEIAGITTHGETDLPKKTKNDSDNEEDDEKDTAKASTTKELENKLFGDESDEENEDGVPKESEEVSKIPQKKSYGDDGYDSMDDFIERDPDEEPDSDDDDDGGGRVTQSHMIASPGDSLAMKDAFDIFGMDLDELDEIYGAESEEENEYSGGLSSASRSLRKVIEPAVLAANMVTDEADKIRRVDLPERLMNYEMRRELSDVERRGEAKLFALRLMAQKKKCKVSKISEDFPQTSDEEAFEQAIYSVLELMHDGYEVPFIATYRPDEYQPYLTRYDLWRIHDLDQKWDSSQDRRSRLADIAAKLREHMPLDATAIASSSSSVPSSTMSAQIESAVQARRNAEEAQEKALLQQERALAELAAVKSKETSSDAMEVDDKVEKEGDEEKKEEESPGNKEEETKDEEEAKKATSEAEVQELEAAVAEAMAAVEQTSMELETAKEAEEKSRSHGLDSDDDEDDDDEVDDDDELGETSSDEEENNNDSDGFGDGSDDEEDDQVLKAKEKRKMLRKKKKEEKANRLALKLKIKQEKKEAKLRKQRMMERGVIGPDQQDMPESLDRIWKYSFDDVELDDVQVYLRLMQESVLGSFGVFESRRRRHARTNYLDLDLYRRCVAYGLKPLARQFMCSASALAEAMTESSVVLPPTPKLSPKQLAAKFVKKDISEISTPKRVMKAVRSMVAIELSCEPRIKKIVREIYEGKKEFDSFSRGKHHYSGATLSTKPTKKGIQELDVFHRYHGLQYISKKPCQLMLEEARAASHRDEEDEDAASYKISSTAENVEREGEDDSNDIRYHTGHAEARQTLYFRILEAKREGLITYSIDPALSRNKDDPFEHYRFRFENAGALVATSKGNEVTEAWNAERLMLLEDCIQRRMLPFFQTDMQKQLRKTCKDAVIAGAVKKFKRKYLEVGPYQRGSRVDALSHSRPGGLQVVSVCVSENSKHGHVLVALTEQGAVRDHLALAAGKRREDNRKEIFEFLYAYKPDIIAVSASAGRAALSMIGFLKDLKEDVMLKHREDKEKLKQFEDYNDDDDDENEDDYDDEAKNAVLLVPDELAKIFASSPRSLDEFPDYQSSKNLLIAIALGRFVQEPLAEVTYLWSHGKANKSGRRGEEALYLGLHPMADRIAKTSLLSALERELIISVCDCGVSLNAAALHLHRQSMLAFVAGLGPVKGQDLISKIKKLRHSQVAKRSALKQLLGSKVFSNAAGFLRIKDYRNVHLNPLDDTRIHPETILDHEW